MLTRPGFFGLLLLSVMAQPALAQDQPPPKGEVTKYTFEQSKTFPGTVRDYWVYVPKQYDPAKPACVYVNQDGIQFNAPAVFDQLIHKKEMPVVIGVFVTPGRVKAISKNALDRFNRSYEYDGLGDNYVRFLLEELLPDVEKKKTADGRALKLSKDGNDLAIGGSSSGAVCAFTAAWERPNEFRRVFSAIGTYVGLRGANEYPTLIRKYEPKPLRVFLQDGTGDLNIYGGDWWMANQEMERSLTFAGYEVKHSWDKGGHSNAEGTKVFPEAMRWLWKDWPSPVKAGAGSAPLKEILLPGEGWKLLGEGYHGLTGASANARGEVFFNERGFREKKIDKGILMTAVRKTHRIGLDGKVSDIPCDDLSDGLEAFGPDGMRYVVSFNKVLRFNGEGKAVEHAALPDGHYMRGLVVRHDGGIFVTSVLHKVNGGDPLVETRWVNVWYITPKGEKIRLDSFRDDVGAVTLSPDQSLLYVVDAKTHWVYSFQIQADGSLAHKQQYFHLHAKETENGQNTDSRCMCVDRDGRLYVTTLLGIQICDQAGRVNCIVPTPYVQATSICFGGNNFDTLFAMCGDKIYARKLKVRGANAFEAPIKPAAPRL